MKQYLLSIGGTDGPTPPPEVLEPVMRQLHALNEEMRAAGAWVFGAPLHAPETATVIRVRDGDTLITDGPYVEAKEHIGGFTIIRAPDLDAAMEWGTRLATVLAGLPVEVRPFAGED